MTDDDEAHWFYKNEGRAEERAGIVAWLRSSTLNHEGPMNAEDFADRIERGHLPNGNITCDHSNKPPEIIPGAPSVKEGESPDFRPPQVDALAARGYERVNRSTPSAEPPGISTEPPGIRDQLPGNSTPSAEYWGCSYCGAMGSASSRDDHRKVCQEPTPSGDCAEESAVSPGESRASVHGSHSPVHSLDAESYADLIERTTHPPPPNDLVREVMFRKYPILPTDPEAEARVDALVARHAPAPNKRHINPTPSADMRSNRAAGSGALGALDDPAPSADCPPALDAFPGINRASVHKVHNPSHTPSADPEGYDGEYWELRRWGRGGSLDDSLKDTATRPILTPAELKSAGIDGIQAAKEFSERTRGMVSSAELPPIEKVRDAWAAERQRAADATAELAATVEELDRQRARAKAAEAIANTTKFALELERKHAERLDRECAQFCDRLQAAHERAERWIGAYDGQKAWTERLLAALQKIEAYDTDYTVGPDENVTRLQTIAVQALGGDPAPNAAETVPAALYAALLEAHAAQLENTKRLKDALREISKRSLTIAHAWQVARAALGDDSTHAPEHCTCRVCDCRGDVCQECGKPVKDSIVPGPATEPSVVTQGQGRTAAAGSMDSSCPHRWSKVTTASDSEIFLCDHCGASLPTGSTRMVDSGDRQCRSRFDVDVTCDLPAAHHERHHHVTPLGSRFTWDDVHAIGEPTSAKGDE